jgi:hypothetical protein
MKLQNYDLIGDLHGQYDKLRGLLLTLGYEANGGGFTHHQGRKVIFLGDYIDRGPRIREVLQTVRAMVDAGDALAIMGNHEYNAICRNTQDEHGNWLRETKPVKDKGYFVTLEQFKGLEEEWRGWLEWMKALPLYLELNGLRAVHACWDTDAMEEVAGRSMADLAFLRASKDKTRPEFTAVERLLNGPELAMPAGTFYQCKEDRNRTHVRVRWWDIPEATRVTEIAMPFPLDVPGMAAPEELRALPNYGPDERPVFFGHYWMPQQMEKAPLRHNIACLDFSAAHTGPLVGYRWDGEQVLSAEKFVAWGMEKEKMAA